MPKQLIPAPTPQPPLYGLVAAAKVINDGVTWEDGFKFAPESCGVSGKKALNCFGGFDTPMEGSDNRDAIEGDPFVIWAADQCTTLTRGRDRQARARRQLEITRSFQIASELWDGELAQDEDLANRFLVDTASDVLTNGAIDVLDALACVEQGIATYGRGARGMVHMTPQVLVHLRGAQAIDLSGTTWVTPNGNIVVADAGYSGAGPLSGGSPVPAGATQWIYGTSMIALRMSAVETLPASEDDPVSGVTRATNDLTVYAQQLVAYEWDECVHVAAEVDVPTCLIGGAS